MGEWKIFDNPCKGVGAESSFRSQASYIIPVAGKNNTFIYMADRWTPTLLADSRYLFLPIEFKNDGKLEVKWYDKWNFDEKIEGVYKENPQGPALEIKSMLSNDFLQTKPDMLVKRRIPDQDVSALAWVYWQSGKITLKVLAYPESNSSLDGNNSLRDDDLFDIWLDYFQVSVSANGKAWRVIPGGGGYGDHSGIALTQRYVSNAIKSSIQKNVTSTQAHLLQLPLDTKANLYTIEIEQSLAEMLPIKENRTFALALVINNKDRSGKNIKNRGYSPLGWRWADTDTYHKATLIK
jgi:hypothetical protein